MGKVGGKNAANKIQNPWTQKCAKKLYDMSTKKNNTGERREGFTIWRGEARGRRE